jgi:hypothetical protein
MARLHSFFQGKSIGRVFKLMAEIEVKGICYPLQWVCQQKLGDNGSLTLRPTAMRFEPLQISFSVTGRLKSYIFVFAVVERDRNAA